VANHQFHQKNELGHKEDESKNGKTQQGVGKYLTDHVAIKDTHLRASLV
jgi:hypothetical protein